MLGKDTSILSLIGAIAFAGMLGVAGKDMYAVMSAKAKAQSEAVASLRDWKRQYEALLPVEKRWDSSLSPFSDFKDLYQIHSKLNEGGIGIDADKLVASKIERLTDAGNDLGAQSICVGYQGGPFKLSDDSYTKLTNKLLTFISRSDIQVGSFSFKTGSTKEKATVTIDPVCLILRDDTKGSTP